MLWLEGEDWRGRGKRGSHGGEGDSGKVLRGDRERLGGDSNPE